MAMAIEEVAHTPTLNAYLEPSATDFTADGDVEPRLDTGSTGKACDP
jgi:hypothetical protein